ncbi:hypothetical protein [uncultured Anaerovibrio sp.]|uniref:hypothetical protein n=1 Tax=uncultured Anaerovibrio sp. TaxID=361586 RepID=UPI002635D0AC|nr:hypothetical protein [uncultured Anaerovibrio sp.]
MPATKFSCPDGQEIAISGCLDGCRCGTRCMFLPTLRAVAQSSDRKLDEPTVTELISGSRETYLKKITKYTINPESTLYALQGQGIHGIHENFIDGDILSEVRLKDGTTSGKFDLYGQLLDEDTGCLGDLKVTSSYKIMRALGYYKKSVPTGEVYKTGAKKGQPKYRQELFTDGVRHVMDWAIQLNYYRILLEQQGFTVNNMVIQAICRDSSLRIAAERGIDRSVYLIPIKKISDRWLIRYFKHKAKVLKEALASKEIPKVCSARERWHDRKCLDYCDVADYCDYGLAVKQSVQKKVS